MTDPLCRWCTRPKSEHRFRLGALLSSLMCAGWSEMPSPPAASLAIFGKPMILAETHPGLHHTNIGPFECILMPAVGANRGRWWWSIETRPKFADVTSDYVDTPEAGAKAIEKALMDIETSIRRARTK